MSWVIARSRGQMLSWHTAAASSKRGRGSFLSLSLPDTAAAVRNIRNRIGTDVTLLTALYNALRFFRAANTYSTPPSVWRLPGAPPCGSRRFPCCSAAFHTLPCCHRDPDGVWRHSTTGLRKRRGIGSTTESRRASPHPFAPLSCVPPGPRPPRPLLPA